MENRTRLPKRGGGGQFKLYLKGFCGVYFDGSAAGGSDSRNNSRVSITNGGKELSGKNVRCGVKARETDPGKFNSILTNK